jgi:hypothetical protein
MCLYVYIYIILWLYGFSTCKYWALLLLLTLSQVWKRSEAHLCVIIY